MTAAATSNATMANNHQLFPPLSLSEAADAVPELGGADGVDASDVGPAVVVDAGLGDCPGWVAVGAAEVGSGVSVGFAGLLVLSAVGFEVGCEVGVALGSAVVGAAVGLGGGVRVGPVRDGAAVGSVDGRPGREGLRVGSRLAVGVVVGPTERVGVLVGAGRVEGPPPLPPQAATSAPTRRSASANRT